METRNKSLFFASSCEKNEQSRECYMMKKEQEKEAAAATARNEGGMKYKALENYGENCYVYGRMMMIKFHFFHFCSLCCHFSC
jgi:hypothetical protein